MPALAPSAATLERALRRAVQNVYKQGKLEDLTVKRIRKAAEVELGLDEDFYKTDGEWKDRSKRIISEEVDAHAENETSSRPASVVQSPEKGELMAGKMKKEEGAGKGKGKGKKRKSAEEGEAKKRPKKTEDQSDEDVDGFEDKVTEEEDASPRVSRRRTASTLSPPPPREEIETSQDVSPPTKSKTKTNGAPPDEQSESEMSVLIDEPPKKTKKSKGQPRKSGAFAKLKKEKKAGAATQQKKKKTGTTTHEAADPDQDEIKRLQGWLMKCGIRKMWWKELQPFDSPREKIRHLKEMLAEAGMVGRYSLEKAAAIREERELRADLEAVQEGARIWGKEDEDEDVVDGGGDGEGGGGRPKRQVARGLQGLDFLNDEDGEETD